MLILFDISNNIIYQDNISIDGKNYKKIEFINKFPIFFDELKTKYIELVKFLYSNNIKFTSIFKEDNKIYYKSYNDYIMHKYINSLNEILLINNKNLTYDNIISNEINDVNFKYCFANYQKCFDIQKNDPLYNSIIEFITKIKTKRDDTNIIQHIEEDYNRIFKLLIKIAVNNIFNKFKIYLNDNEINSYDDIIDIIETTENLKTDLKIVFINDKYLNEDYKKVLLTYIINIFEIVKNMGLNNTQKFKAIQTILNDIDNYTIQYFIAKINDDYIISEKTSTSTLHLFNKETLLDFISKVIYYDINFENIDIKEKLEEDYQNLEPIKNIFIRIIILIKLYKQQNKENYITSRDLEYIYVSLINRTTEPMITGGSIIRNHKLKYLIKNIYKNMKTISLNQ